MERVNHLQPFETLPGLLIGERVKLHHGSTTGTVLETGHAYGPGGGHDQARVLFRTFRPGDPGNPHPLKRRASAGESSGWYYLETLEFAP